MPCTCVHRKRRVAPVRSNVPTPAEDEVGILVLQYLIDLETLCQIDVIANVIDTFVVDRLYTVEVTGSAKQHRAGNGPVVLIRQAIGLECDWRILPKARTVVH